MNKYVLTINDEFVFGNHNLMDFKKFVKHYGKQAYVCTNCGKKNYFKFNEEIIA